MGVCRGVRTDEETLDPMSCSQLGEVILCSDIILEILPALVYSLERNIDLPESDGVLVGLALLPLLPVAPARGPATLTPELLVKVGETDWDDVGRELDWAVKLLHGQVVLNVFEIQF